MRRSGPLRRTTPLRATSPMRRSRKVGEAGDRSKVPDDVRQAVEYRAGFGCEVSGPNCTGRGEHLHHVLPRSAGGAHTEANLVLACAADHRWIHSHPDESYTRGWLRRRGSMDKPP